MVSYLRRVRQKKSRPSLGGHCTKKKTSSLRWHYPEQVLGVSDTITAALSARYSGLPLRLYVSWSVSLADIRASVNDGGS